MKESRDLCKINFPVRTVQSQGLLLHFGCGVHEVFESAITGRFVEERNIIFVIYRRVSSTRYHCFARIYRWVCLVILTWASRLKSNLAKLPWWSLYYYINCSGIASGSKSRKMVSHVWIKMISTHVWYHFWPIS